MLGYTSKSEHIVTTCFEAHKMTHFLIKQILSFQTSLINIQEFGVYCVYADSLEEAMGLRVQHMFRMHHCLQCHAVFKEA